MSNAIPNDIYIGSVNDPLYHYDNDSIILDSMTGVFSVDVVGNELSVDTFSFSVRYVPSADSGAPVMYGFFVPADADALIADGDVFQVFAGYSGATYLNDLKYGTPVYWYSDGAFFTKGYLKSIDRTGKNAWRLTCISGIGLLDEIIHVGGIYTGQALSTILSSIVGSAFVYTVAEDVGNVTVYGRLPYDTARNNLHRLLFSCGASVLRGPENSDYSFVFLQQSPVNVSEKRIAYGGSVGVQLPANVADVTEHTFFQAADTEATTLFDNTDGAVADHLIVVFDEPIYDLAATDLTINASGVNYADVSGVGVLTGKQYVHSQRIISENHAAVGEAPRIKRVTDNQLIGTLNSLNTAKRVLNYYGNARTLKSRLMLAGEKCGDLLSMSDAFGEPAQAFLQRMTILATSVIGASCELVENFVPGFFGNNFNNRIVITGSGAVTLPSGVTFIRVVMIAGGDGGQGGYDGAHGMGDSDQLITRHISPSYDEQYVAAAYYTGTQHPASGGAAGAAGSAGKVLIFDVTVTDSEVLTAVIGAGGAGGARNGAAGAAGGATSLSSASIATRSTDDGQIVQAYVDPMTGDFFAVIGEDGHPGSAGGMSDTVSDVGYSGADGLPGEDNGDYTGGAGGVGYKFESGNVGELLQSSGGGGGGAAWGNNGSAGANGINTYPQPEGSYRYIHGGNGGAGANAAKPVKPAYGSGGSGGNGGGGGRNAGGGIWYNPIWSGA